METDRPSSLGAHLKNLRRERGLTLTEVAEKLAFSPSYLHHLEAGNRTKPHPDYLHRLAGFYDVLVEDLYALAGYTPAGELPDLPAYLRSKYGLSDEVIREIENYTEFLTERDK